MIVQLLLVGIWIICGIIHYGISLAFYQREWPSIAEETYNRDVSMVFFMSLFGPIALLAALLNKEVGHGIKFVKQEKSE